MPIDFSPLPPLLAVHLGAGNAACCWPPCLWKGPGRRVSRRRMAGRRRRGDRTTSRSRPSSCPTIASATGLDSHGHPDHRIAGAGRPLHRGRFRPGPPGGFRGHALGHPLQRYQPTPAMGASGRGIRSPSATASPASLATRRSACSLAIPACRASTPIASTEARCGGGPARTGRRPPPRADVIGSDLVADLATPPDFRRRGSPRPGGPLREANRCPKDRSLACFLPHERCSDWARAGRADMGIRLGLGLRAHGDPGTPVAPGARVAPIPSA